jgi:hypothetical protein
VSQVRNEQSFTDQMTHCIKATKVYDWVKLMSEIKIEEKICIDQQKTFTDMICCEFRVPCSKTTPSTLWTRAGIENISGTLSIEYTSGCGNPLVLIINGKIAASLSEGQSFCTTIVDLQSVELLCQGNPNDSGFCIGEFKIVLHFQPAMDELDLKNVKCFLSDCHGRPLCTSDPRSLICEEISDERKTTQVTLSNGKTQTLNKVVVQKKGFITIQLFDKTGNLCKTCTVPFSEIETILLCAPPETKLECKILHFDCEAYVIPPIDRCNPFVEIAIIISICQSVKTTAETIMEVKGILCEKARQGDSKLITHLFPLT